MKTQELKATSSSINVKMGSALELEGVTINVLGIEVKEKRRALLQK
jgi:hypothetical protein